jgi:transcriptional regulator with XRE-family HTH domain
MSTEFALDLRLARRKSGYTQRDTAHLLGLNRSKLSLLETGQRLPSLVQICTLSLIYGRSFESLFGAIMDEARSALRTRILTLPDTTRKYAGSMNRTHSIDRLARSLAVDPDDDHGGA